MVYTPGTEEVNELQPKLASHRIQAKWIQKCVQQLNIQVTLLTKLDGI